MNPIRVRISIELPDDSSSEFERFDRLIRWGSYHHDARAVLDRLYADACAWLDRQRAPETPDASDGTDGSKVTR